MDQYANSEADLNPLTREFFGFPAWLLAVFVFCILIMFQSLFRSVKKKATRPQLICKNTMKEGEIGYRCNQCQKKYGGLLCHACFVESPHASHKYTQVKVMSGVKPCHCGNMKSFKRKPTCNNHLAQKGILKSTRNIEINGFVIPVSPDGIPMVQFARKTKTGDDKLELIADGMASERKKSHVTFLKHSLYGHPGYPPVPGSRRAEGLDPLEMAVEEIISSQSSQESYENDMLYGFKRKEGAEKGMNFADVVQQISEKSKSDNRKRSTAYVLPSMARNSRSCSVVVTNSTDSSLIPSTDSSFSSNSTYSNRFGVLGANQALPPRMRSHLWTNDSNPLFDVRPWNPALESIR